MSARLRFRWSPFVFLASVSVLAVAFWLDPNPHGVGTHTQLGLEPCVLMSAFSVPCPMCGMTTTFSLMADLRPVAGIANQPLGAMLFAMTVAIVCVSAFEILAPRERWRTIAAHIECHKSRYLVLFSTMFFGSWVYKIAIMMEISQ